MTTGGGLIGGGVPWLDAARVYSWRPPSREVHTYVVCWVQMLFLCPTRNQRPSHLGCLNRGRLRLRGTYCTSQWYSTLPQESSTSYWARYVIPRWSRHLARTRNTVSSSSSAALSGTVAAPPCEKKEAFKTSGLCRKTRRWVLYWRDLSPGAVGVVQYVGDTLRHSALGVRTQFLCHQPTRRDRQ